MPNDRVQLRPPRRLTAACAILWLKPQNALSGKEFDIGACIIDVTSVLNPSFSASFQHSALAPLNSSRKCNLVRAVPEAAIQPRADQGFPRASMGKDDSGAKPPESPRSGFLSRYVFSTNHKTIGLNYLWLALFSVFLGMAMSLLMRIHLVWPGVHLPLLSRLRNSPDRFSPLTTLHGSLMVFLVLTAAPQAGFGNYFLPLQIVPREMAFPTLSLLAFFTTLASLPGSSMTF